MKKQMNALVNSPKHWLRALPRKQRGAATILTMLLIGVGLISVSMGAMHMVRSTQERQLAVHAQVNSQAGVWATVETVRAYLQTLSKDQLTTLNENQTWTITGIDNLTQQAILVDVIPPISPAIDFKVRAILTATDISARSSSSMEVVYSVKPSSSGTRQMSGVLDFYNDLQTTGGISLNANNGAGLNFNVDGDFSATSAGIDGTGFGNINVTGNIFLDSQVAANVVRGRNITLTQAANVKRAEAWGIPTGETGSLGNADSKGKGFTCCGDISIKAWEKDNSVLNVVTTAHANGNINSEAGKVTTIMARGNVSVKGKGSDSVSALGNVEILASTARAQNVLAGGNLTLSDKVDSLGATMAAVGVADCPSNNPNGHSIKTKLAANLRENCKGVVDASITAPIITRVPEVKLIPPVVDSWALEPAANYAIKFTEDKKVRVTVKNVNGIADGDNYYLGHYNKAQMHLCKEVTVAGNLSTCVTTGTNGLAKEASMPFCINYNEDTSCITPNFDNKTLTIKADSIPASMPAGVIWFDGSLNLMGGAVFQHIYCDA